MSNHFIGATLALLTAIFWAAGVLLFKLSDHAMSPFALNYFKNTVASVLFALTFVALGEPFWPDGAGTDAAWLMASGALGLGIGDILFFRSLYLLGASCSAVIETLYAPLVTASAFVLLGEQPHVQTLVGGVLIIVGILAVVTSKSHDRGPSALSRVQLIDGLITGILAVLIMSVSVVAVKPIIEDHSVLWGTSLRMVGGLLISSIALPFFAELRRETWAALRPQPGWRFALPGAIFGTDIALFCWIGGYKYTSASVTSLLNQTSTLFIVLGAAVFLGERLTFGKLVAVALAVAGSAIVLLGAT